MKKLIFLLSLSAGVMNARQEPTPFENALHSLGAITKAAIQTVHAHPILLTFLASVYINRDYFKQETSPAPLFLTGIETLVFSPLVHTASGYVLKNLESHKIIYLDVNKLCERCKKNI
ncbi:MAG: hypothetical protein ACOYT8_01520 [Candidatus Dependentiae bacterium]